MKISPKLKRILSREYVLQESKANDICNEMNKQFNIYHNSNSVDSENIYALVSAVTDELSKSESYSKYYHSYEMHSFAPILFYCTIHSITKYDVDIFNDFEKIMRKHNKRGTFGMAILNEFLHGVKILRAYFEEGIILPNPVRVREKRKLSTNLNDLLDVYKNRIDEYKALSKNTLENRLAAIRAFLYQLERQGVSEITGFTHKNINECITAISPNYDGGLQTTLYNIRHFLSFLHDIRLTDIDYSEAMPCKVPKRRKIQFGFTSEEIESILGSINRSTALEKRNYAIILLAIRTGLRRCDIAALKRRDIDWHSKEIRIVQEKTGVALSFPLTPEVGNAIIDYFFNARGENNSEYVFVKRQSSEESIGRKTITALTKKYMRMADIDESLPRRGIHSFRRSFGKKMLEASLSAEMLMELLGQVDVNSVKPYSAIDENGLRYCALSLSSVRMVSSEI